LPKIKNPLKGYLILCNNKMTNASFMSSGFNRPNEQEYKI